NNRVEVQRIATVPNDTAAIDPGLVEAEQQAIEGRVRTQCPGEHQTYCLGPQNPAAPCPTLLQVRKHELRHVRCDRGTRTRGRPVMDHLERLAFEHALTHHIST